MAFLFRLLAPAAAHAAQSWRPAWLLCRFADLCAHLRRRRAGGCDWATRARFAAITEAGVLPNYLISGCVHHNRWVAQVVLCQWLGVLGRPPGGRGVLFLTPRLGCFEISVMCCGPLTDHRAVRPAKQAWLRPGFVAGPRRHAQACGGRSVGGVRSLVKALAPWSRIGMLPDQVPGRGEGV